MSEPTNPYQAPEANLAQPVTGIGGSIENTLAGNADLEFGSILAEAWQKTKGIKRIVDGGGILVYVGITVVTIGLALIFGADSNTILATLITQLVVMILVYPFLAGVFIVGLRQSVGLPVSFDMVFAQYAAALPLVGIGVLQSVASSIGFLLLLLPGLYLTFALSLAIPLRIDKQMSVADSPMMSLQLVNKKFFTVVALGLTPGLTMLTVPFILVFVVLFQSGSSSLIGVLGFIVIVSWLWGIPWMLMVFAITYRQLAGTELTE